MAQAMASERTISSSKQAGGHRGPSESSSLERSNAHGLGNTRQEGTAPMTIQVLVDRLREEPRIHDCALNAARAFLLASRTRTNAPRSP